MIKKPSQFVARVLGAALLVTRLATPAAHADVLEPYDGIPGDPWGGGLLLYPAYWRYPTYKDAETGNVKVDASIRAAAVKGGLFLPKVAGKYDWGLSFSLPYLNIDGDGLKKQAGTGDPGFGAAIWPYADTQRNIYLSLWWITYFPWGDYDAASPASSPGIDAYTHVPSIELGVYGDRFSLDAVLQYWNRTESDKLRIELEDAIELDAVLSWNLSKGIIASLHVNAYAELGDMRIDGAEQRNTRGHRYALGPKLSYLLGDVMFSLTWLHDVDVKNMLQGDWIYGRVAFPF